MTDVRLSLNVTLRPKGESFEVVGVEIGQHSPLAAHAPTARQDNLLGMPFSREYLAFVKAYPHERGKTPGGKVWQALAPDADLIAAITAALEQHKRLEAWQDVQFVPNLDKWLLDRRWEEDLRGQKFVVPVAAQAPKCGRPGCSIRGRMVAGKDGVRICEQCAMEEGA